MLLPGRTRRSCEAFARLSTGSPTSPGNNAPAGGLSRSKRGAGLAGYLDVLARGDDQRANRRAERRDVAVRPGGGVAALVHGHAEEPQPGRGFGTDLGLMLPDTAGEHQGVQAIEG